ncbi:DUF6180 family protein [Reyranella sp. CPCC 100927]|uniref:DUF6180 family protein n=1 Tax=Reyranella sp. CPCC 100927 TaxID=2599616 RepID=UPI0011B75CE3|nr:DUF6180 family protein [Reyranella sp. CPCC 100927]TWS96314.1 hypothetical protein FQU96_39200 [Reyranella sp. CPCC 100927]
MTRAILLPFAVSLLGFSGPGLAQNVDFNLTYHVERTPAARLSIETCSNAVAQTARQAGLRVDVKNYPGQLATVVGGRDGSGAFVAQCIAVDGTTVSVIQGIDYRKQKGSLGEFADRAFEAVKAATK